MEETLEETDIVADGVALAEATKERMKTDPDAVRKILRGTVTVEEDVTVYPNKALNLEYSKFQAKLGELANSTRKDADETDEQYLARTETFRADFDKAQAEFLELKDRVADSAVTFHLVSVSKKALKNLRTVARKKFPIGDGPDDIDVAEQRDAYYQAQIVAAHMVKDGYTVEDMQAIQDEWPTRCWAQLWTTAQKLSISDDYLGMAFDADF